MCRGVLTAVAVVAVLALAYESFSADTPAALFPKPGSEIPGPFQPYNATGKKQDKFHCLVCRHGLDPTVMIFAPLPDPEPSAPFNKLLQELDKLVTRHPRERLGGFVVFLMPEEDFKIDDKREAMAETLRGWAKKAELKDDQVVLSLEKAAGPVGYKLPEGHTTVVVYNQLKVVSHFDFEKPLTDENVTAVLQAVEKLVPEK